MPLTRSSTTSVDTPGATPPATNTTGTKNDDTFIGNQATLSSSDILEGNAGTDTLQLTNTGGSYNETPAGLTSIEKIQLTSSGTASTTLGMAQATGVETVTSLNSTNDDIVTNLQSLADIVVDGSSNSVTATYADSLVTADGSASVEVKGGATLGTLTVAGVTSANEFETLNLTSNGSEANAVTQVNADESGSDSIFAAVKASGTADLTLGDSSTDLDATSVDASELGGSLDLFVGSSETKGGVTATDNNDTIVISDAGSFFGTGIEARTVDFGEGADTMQIDEDLTSLSASGSDAVHTISGLETLDLDAAGSSGSVTVDANLIDGLTDIDATLTNNDTTSGSSSGSEFIGKIDDIRSESVNVTGVTGEDEYDVVDLELDVFDGSASDTTLSANLGGNFGTVTAADSDDDSGSSGDQSGGVEKVSIEAVADLTIDDANDPGTEGLVADKAFAVDLAGSSDITISALDLGTTDTTDSSTANDKVVVDASSLEGDLDLTKSETGVYEFKTGTASNTIDLGTNATDTTVTGNGTSDEVSLTNTSGDNTIDLTTTAVDTVTFGTVSGGNDTLDLANVNADATIKVVDGDGSGGKDATFSNINGQAFDVVVASGDNFSSATTELGLAEGVAGATVTLSGVNKGAYDGTLETSGTLTVDQQIANTSGDFADESIALAGASSTDQLTGLVLKGGGTDTSGDSTTVTLTGAGDDVALTSLDATGFTGDLDVTDVSGPTNMFDQAVSPATIDLGGSGVLTVRAEDLLRDQLDINGGTGETTVAATGVGASGSTTSLRPDLASVETLDLTLVETDASSGADTAINLRDSAGVTTVVLDVAEQSSSGDDFANDLTISDLANNGTVQIAATASGDTSIGANDKGVIIDSPVNSATTATVTNTGSTENVILGADNASGGGVAVGSTYTDLTIDQVTDQNLTIGTVSGDGVTTLDLNNNTASGDGTLKVNALSTTSLATLTIDSSVGAVNVLDLGTVDSLETLTVDTGDSSGGNTTIGSGSSSSIDTITASGTGDFEITALTATDLDLIDAAEVSGGVTLGSGGSALTTADGAGIKTGAGDDTVSVNLSTFGAIDLGFASGDSDTLRLVGAQGSGTGEIDLSQAGDQILQVNGFADSAVQTNIENVDVSNVTSNNSYGWKITAAEGGSTITGSDYNDEIIGGAGGDNITGGAGADTIQLGDGNDIVTLATGDGSAVGVASGDFSGFDTITEFTTQSGGAGDQIDATSVSDSGDTVVVNSDAASSGGNDLDFSSSDQLDVDKVVSFLSDLSGDTSKLQDGNTDIVAITDSGGTDETFLYYVVDGTSGGSIDAGEVQLVGSVDVVLDSADFSAL